MRQTITHLWQEYREPFFIFTGSRLLVLSVATLVAGYQLGNVNWFSWDAHHYLHIAEHGYQVGDYTGETSYIAFLPLWPTIVKIVATLLWLPTHAAAFLLTYIFGLTSTITLFWYVKKWKNKEVATQATLLYAFFPTSVFLTVPYTESLFALLALGALSLLETKQLTKAALLTSLATVTRLTGFILVPILALAAWRYKLGFVKTTALVLLSLLPFAVFLYYQDTVFGTPWAFLEAQKINWHHTAAWPWQGLASVWQGAQGNDAVAFMWLLDLVILTAMAGTLIAATKRVPFAILLFGWGIVLLTLSSTFILGAARYLMMVFPFYLFWGDILAKQSLLRTIAVALLASWLTFNTILFTLHKTIF